MNWEEGPGDKNWGHGIVGRQGPGEKEPGAGELQTGIWGQELGPGLVGRELAPGARNHLGMWNCERGTGDRDA